MASAHMENRNCCVLNNAIGYEHAFAVMAIILYVFNAGRYQQGGAAQGCEYDVCMFHFLQNESV